MRLLYIHGLESGPRGRKVLELESAGVEVVALQMPCSTRAMARDPAVLGVAGALVGTLAALTLAGWTWALLGLALALAAAPALKQALVRRAFSRSLAIQARALLERPVEVVMGSSYGGAVALALLQSGRWRGPTVLLCPAGRLVAERAGLALPGPLRGTPALVVHGRQDEVVPLGDSEALVGAGWGRLVVVEDDHRLSATATGAQLRAWAEEALALSP